jgi:hypothetical protein
MTLMVAATSTDGRFSGLEGPASESALERLLDELERRGDGYLEIRHSDAQWPCLTVGLAGSQAVIHLFGSPDSVSLLQGDVADAPEVVEVPIMDASAAFDETFALSLASARHVVQEFARGSVPDSPRWHRL